MLITNMQACPSIAKRHHGFTVIEVIAVILIISVLSITIIIQWPASTINLGAQAKQLISDIRYTQALAMTKGQRYYLIRQSSTSYQIRDSAGSPVSLAMGTTTVTLNSGITFGTMTNLPNNLVAFDGQGTPYTTTGTPGTALAATATIALASGSSTQTVSISPQTGRTVLQ